MFSEIELWIKQTEQLSSLAYTHIICVCVCVPLNHYKDQLYTDIYWSSEGLIELSLILCDWVRNFGKFNKHETVEWIEKSQTDVYMFFFSTECIETCYAARTFNTTHNLVYSLLNVLHSFFSPLYNLEVKPISDRSNQKKKTFIIFISNSAIFG